MNRMLSLAGLALLFAGCTHHPEPAAATSHADPVRVRVAKAEARRVDDNYLATATMRGRSTAVLTSKAVGHIDRILVHAGADVERGQLLMRLEARDARAGLAQARASVSQARATIARAESDVEAAQVARRLTEVTWKRIQRLAEQDAVTDQRRDEARSAVEAARARVQVARAALEAARSQRSQARAGGALAAARLDHHVVRAPFDGRVVQRHVDRGDLASPGTPLLTVEALQHLRAEAVVDESLAGRIRLGQFAQVEVGAVEARVTGEVAEIVPAVDAASRAFVVKVALPDDAALERVQPGMFARVRFPTGKSVRLLVPESALSRRGSLERVFVLEDGRARLRLVSSGIVTDGQREILSGLSAGESVVVDPPVALRDASPIKVQP